MGDTVDLQYARADDGSTPSTDSSAYGGHGFRVIFMDGKKIRYGIYRNVQAGWALSYNEVAINLNYVGSSSYWFHYTEDVQADYASQFGGTYPGVQSIQLFANCGTSGYSDAGAFDQVKFKGAPYSNTLTLLPNGGFESALSDSDWLYQSAHSYGRSAAGVWYINPYAGSYLGYVKWDNTGGDVSFVSMEIDQFVIPSIDNSIASGTVTVNSITYSMYHEAGVLAIVIGYIFGKSPLPSMTVTIGGNSMTSLGSIQAGNDIIQAWVLYRANPGTEVIVLSRSGTMEKEEIQMPKFYLYDYMQLIAFSVFGTQTTDPFIGSFNTNYDTLGSTTNVTVNMPSGIARRLLIQGCGFENGTGPYTPQVSQTQINTQSVMSASYIQTSTAQTMSTTETTNYPWISLAFDILPVTIPIVNVDNQVSINIISPGYENRQVYLNTFIQAQYVDSRAVLNITSLLNYVLQNRQVYLSIYSVPGGTTYKFSTVQIPIVLLKNKDSQLEISVGTVLDRQLYASIALTGDYDSQVYLQMLSPITYLDSQVYMAIYATALIDRQLSTSVQLTSVEDRQIYADLILPGYSDRQISLPISAIEDSQIYLEIQQTDYNDLQTYLNISEAVDSQIAMNVVAIAEVDRLLYLAVGMVVTTADRQISAPIQVPAAVDRQIYLKIPFIGRTDRQTVMAIKSKVTPETSTQSSGSASAESSTQSAGSATAESSDEGTGSAIAESSTEGNI